MEIFYLHPTTSQGLFAKWVGKCQDPLLDEINPNVIGVEGRWDGVV